MTPMTAADFERRYRENPDPWGYVSSDYEREKYAATLDACGAGPFDAALELGGSIGVFSAMLSARARRLDTIDVAPRAVAHARERLGHDHRVHVHLGALPDDLPPGPFDLVVASEILYYLTPEALRRTLRRLSDEMVSGARLVAVHWRPAGPDRWFDADGVHARLRSAPWLASETEARTDAYLLDVLRRT